jgi:hypothetical protein
MSTPTLLANFSAAYILTPGGVVGAPGPLDKTFQAADPVNGNYYISSGKDMLIVFNSDTVPHTFGIQSAPDQFGRYANVTYTVPAGGYEVVIISSQAIYTQANGQVLLSASSALVLFLPIQGA